jgi:hypothetical protein
MIAGRIQSFHLAENLPGTSRDENHTRENIKSSQLPIFSQGNTRKLSEHNPDENCRLNEGHYCLRTINARLWKQLRVGALRGCYAGLSIIVIEQDGKLLNWRDVNRKTVSALHRFETVITDTERRIMLREALERISQKLLLVIKSALRKGSRLNFEEAGEIRTIEIELTRISHFLFDLDSKKSVTS